MTELLHMKDNYAKECDATVIAAQPGYVVLDKSCFYPESGGQPGDTGTITHNGRAIQVRSTRKEKGIVKHYVSEDIPKGAKVHLKLDWGRRHMHMRMHSAEHVLSAILLEKYGAEVAGNQIGYETSRIDYKPFRPEGEDLQRIAGEFNGIIDDARPVTIEQTTREDMMRRVDEKRRRLFERLPSFITEVRLVIIKDFDMQPCAGSHIANTKEIGHINILKTENKGSDTTRIVFGLA